MQEPGRLLERVGTVGDDDTGDTRRRVPVEQLWPDAPHERRVAEGVLRRFVDERLLVRDDRTQGGATVEIAHEALLERWPRLAAWIEASGEDLWMRRRLADAAGEWLSAGREPGYLLAGSRLQLFASWAATTAIDRDAGGIELLEGSLAEQQKKQQQKEAAAPAATSATETKSAP